MRYNQFAVTLLLFIGSAGASCAQETDMEKLIAKSDPAIQAQIQRILDVLQKPGIDPRDVDLCREIQAVKKLSPDKDKLVKQLAIFVATMKSAEDIESADAQVSIMQKILQVLDFPPRVPIRVLAPYLDAGNRQLRDSVRLWFHFHDAAATDNGGTPPIKPVNFEDYLEYVESMLTHKEDAPTPFIKYIFKSSPGRALLVFAYANSPNVHIVTGQQKIAAVVQAEKAELREIELAEHIVSNAIWLDKNAFRDRFQAAVPEANAQLAKLAKHKEWWARLYVAYIMRKYPELRQDDVIERLSKDTNELVRAAATR